jgi:spore photoproduct lyase
MCEYCYLATNMGANPYIRVYVNLDEVFTIAREHIEARHPDTTTFEGAATSDPIPTEYLTGALRKAVEFFADQPGASFRFVTKFTEVDSLIDAHHAGRTTIRVSVNAKPVILRFEHATPDFESRIQTAARVARAGYPVGLLIAPVILFDRWEREYGEMIREAARALSGIAERVTLEVVTHRFTARAKKHILDVFPATQLPLDEEARRFKYGQFGYGKYVYLPEQVERVREFFEKAAREFDDATVSYVV